MTEREREGERENVKIIPFFVIYLKQIMKLNWGYSIILFFVVFISLMVAFIIFSLKQNNDLVTDEYYEKGADYTHQMEIDGRSAIFKDSIRLLDQNGVIVAKFAKSILQRADTMHIYFYRPSNKKLDFRDNIVLQTDSVKLDKKNLVTGRYTLTFKWLQGETGYQVEKDFFMK